MSDTDATIAITLRLPPETWRQIRVEAAKEGKSASQWCRESLALVLDKVQREGVSNA